MTRPNDAAYSNPTVFNPNGGEVEWGEYGLTKREYMATIICAGLVQKDGYTKFTHVVEDTLQITDALINALNKGETK